MMDNNKLEILSAVLTSFVFTYVVIPSIINIARIKQLYDEPGERKSHVDVIPNLGGIAIFGGFVISFCLFGNFTNAKEVQYILGALCLTFMLGAKDDIIELTHYKKFLGQIMSAFIIVYFGDIRLTSLYGVFGISDIPYWVSFLFSMTTIVFIINAFNLIDGVNWLAGSVALVIAVSFGSWFFYHNLYEYAILAASMAGAIIAFLRYNYTPAKIFMGDSGSLSVGLLSSVLAIVFIEKNEFFISQGLDYKFTISASPAFAIAVLIIPVFDTLRVFTLRILSGKSPFLADRNHIHHKLLDLGLSHIQTSMVLISTNIAFIVLAFYLQEFKNLWLIVFLFGLAYVLTFILFSIKPESKTSETENKKSKNYEALKTSSVEAI